MTGTQKKGKFACFLNEILVMKICISILQRFGIIPCGVEKIYGLMNILHYLKKLLNKK